MGRFIYAATVMMIGLTALLSVWPTNRRVALALLIVGFLVAIARAAANRLWFYSSGAALLAISVTTYVCFAAPGSALVERSSFGVAFPCYLVGALMFALERRRNPWLREATERELSFVDLLLCRYLQRPDQESIEGGAGDRVTLGVDVTETAK